MYLAHRADIRAEPSECVYGEVAEGPGSAVTTGSAQSGQLYLRNANRQKRKWLSYQKLLRWERCG